MKGCKNPELRQSSVVKSSDMKAKPTSSHSKFEAATVAKKLPKIEFSFCTWFVEHHEDNHQMEVTTEESKDSVYVYKCKNCTLKINGRLNNITIDRCKRVKVVFNDVAWYVDVTNSKRIHVQNPGPRPTVYMENTKRCQVHLSKDSVWAQLIITNSSETNLFLPVGKQQFEEHAIPAEFNGCFNGCWDGDNLVSWSKDRLLRRRQIGMAVPLSGEW